MTDDQREAWRKALAAKAAQHRRQRYRPVRKQLLPNVGAGMVRLPAAVAGSTYACTLGHVSEFSLEDVPGVADAAHEAARGEVVYITEHGQRLAAIVPAALAAELANLSPDELAELLEDFADAALARAARASIEAGERLIPWEQVKAEAGL
jgi:antitoxin (DNA-binding transcriptional repressor) of toxin-antitoxin stability system